MFNYRFFVFLLSNDRFLSLLFLLFLLESLLFGFTFFEILPESPALENIAGTMQNKGAETRDSMLIGTRTLLSECFQNTRTDRCDDVFNDRSSLTQGKHVFRKSLKKQLFPQCSA